MTTVNIDPIRLLVCGDHEFTVRMVGSKLDMKKDSAWKIIAEDYRVCGKAAQKWCQDCCMMIIRCTYRCEDIINNLCIQQFLTKRRIAILKKPPFSPGVCSTCYYLHTLIEAFQVLVTEFSPIKICISKHFTCIWSIDKSLSGATTPGQSGPGSDGNEGVLRIPQISSITGIWPSDCLVSYLGHRYAEMQSVYSTAPAEWATKQRSCLFYYTDAPYGRWLSVLRKS